MSSLVDLRELLQETTAAIAELDRALAGDPQDFGLALTAESLRRRQEDLESAFAEAAHNDHVDLCRYRLIPDKGNRYPVAALTGALGSFQDLITVIFDAIQHGPKIRARPSADVVQLTSFEFAYSYPGSLGLMLTMPNER